MCLTLYITAPFEQLTVAQTSDIQARRGIPRLTHAFTGAHHWPKLLAFGIQPT